MRPIATRRVTGTYGAPKGAEHAVAALPYWRTQDDELGGAPVIWSEWKLDAEELAQLNAGGHVLVGIVGEPIRPFSVGVQPADPPRSDGLDRVEP